MNLLAFDTSTETLSIAVQRAGALPLEHQGAGGPAASARLIPEVQRLLDQAGLAMGQLQAIVFGRGPGSFTGLRTACAVAQGLGFGAGVPLLPVDTLLAVAEDARQRHGAQEVLAVLDARMEEVYFAGYAFAGGAWQARQPPRLGRPGQVQLPDGWVLAGNACAAFAGRGLACVDAMPAAAALLRLAPALLAAGLAVEAAEALPLYVRDNVAQTTEERAAARAARGPAA